MGHALSTALRNRSSFGRKVDSKVGEFTRPFPPLQKQTKLLILLGIIDGVTRKWPELIDFAGLTLSVEYQILFSIHKDSQPGRGGGLFTRIQMRYPTESTNL